MLGGRRAARPDTRVHQSQFGPVQFDEIRRQVQLNTLNAELVLADHRDVYIPSALHSASCTVILRAYQEPQEWVTAAINSALAMADDVEVLFMVDGGGHLYSLPDSPRIARYYFHTNRGCGWMRFLGNRLAKGHCVRILDADDVLVPKSAMAQTRLITGDVKLLFGRVNPVESEYTARTWPQHIDFMDKWDHTDLGMYKLLSECPYTVVPGPTAVWDRQWALEAEYDTDWSYCEDGAWYRSLLSMSEPTCVSWYDKPVLRYRVRQDSMSGRGTSPAATMQRRCMDARIAMASTYGAYCRTVQTAKRRKLWVIDQDRLCCGGAQWSMMQLAANLDRRAFDVSFVTSETCPQPKQWLETRGIRVMTPGCAADYKDWVTYLASVERPDAIDYVWNVWHHTKELQSFTRWSLAHMQSTELKFSGLDHTQHLFNSFVCVSQAVQDRMPKLDVPMPVIQSPVDVLRMREELASRWAVRASLGITPEQPLVIWSGRVAGDEKRADLMRQLAEELRGKARFVVAGIVSDNHPRADAIRAEWQSWSSRNGVHWFDNLWPWQVSKLFAASDVYLNTSDLEGQSLALLEAMAAGLPVVVTDVGGARESVVDGVTGSIVKPGDANAMYSAICAFADMSREERCARGKLSSDHMMAMFDIRQHTRAYSAKLWEWLGV